MNVWKTINIQERNRQVFRLEYLPIAVLQQSVIITQIMIDGMSDVLHFMKNGDIIKETKIMEVGYEKSSL